MKIFLLFISVKIKHLKNGKEKEKTKKEFKKKIEI